MENTQAASQASQAAQEGCMPEQQEKHKPEEYQKMSGQDQHMMGAPQFYGQGSGVEPCQQVPQMGAQTMTAGIGNQFQGMMEQPAGVSQGMPEGQYMMGQPGGTGQGMPTGHPAEGESCGCQGSMEGHAYGVPPANVYAAPMMPPSFAGPQGVPQMGPVGQPQPHAVMNGGGCAEQFGSQPVQAGSVMQGMPFQYSPIAAPPQAPMMPQGMPVQHGPMGASPQAPMMPQGMPAQGHTAPQYGPQVPFSGPMPMTGHSCGGSGHAGHGAHGHSGQQPLHDQHQYQYQYGQLMDIVGDMMAGNPDVSKIMGFFQSCDAQFLKGVLVGAVGMFLLTNETVKSTIFDMISGVWGTFQKEKETVEEEPPEAQKTPTKTRSRTSKTAEK